MIFFLLGRQSQQLFGWLKMLRECRGFGNFSGFTEGGDRSVLVVDEKTYHIFKAGGSEDIP
jgi:hypothetical protein